MNSNTKDRDSAPGVLASLRALVPRRHVTFAEALRIAEHQAAQLLHLSQTDDAPVPREVVATLPRIRIVREYQLPVSGSTHWNGEEWIITINGSEPWARQRFTLMHEFKHIVDHGQTERLYLGNHHRQPHEQAEAAADYFAGCVLVPKRLLKRAWSEGLRHPVQLARRFAVSAHAAEVRLAQVGLSRYRRRCQQPDENNQSPQPYLRLPSPTAALRNMP